MFDLHIQACINLISSTCTETNVTTVLWPPYYHDSLSRRCHKLPSRERRVLTTALPSTGNKHNKSAARTTELCYPSDTAARGRFFAPCPCRCCIARITSAWLFSIAMRTSTKAGLVKYAGVGAAASPATPAPVPLPDPVPVPDPVPGPDPDPDPVPDAAPGFTTTPPLPLLMNGLGPNPPPVWKMAGFTGCVMSGRALGRMPAAAAASKMAVLARCTASSLNSVASSSSVPGMDVPRATRAASNKWACVVGPTLSPRSSDGSSVVDGIALAGGLLPSGRSSWSPWGTAYT